MSCERCKDIHKAQVEGKTQRACGCGCHNKFYTGTTTANTTGSTVTFGSNDITSNTFTLSGDTAVCGTTFGFGNCTCGCGCC